MKEEQNKENQKRLSVRIPFDSSYKNEIKNYGAVKEAMKHIGVVKQLSQDHWKILNSVDWFSKGSVGSSFMELSSQYQNLYISLMPAMELQKQIPWEIIKSMENNNKVFGSALEFIQKNSLLSQATLVGITKENLGSGLSETLKKSLERTFTNFTDSYNILNDDFVNLQDSLKYPADILSIPSEEMYLSSNIFELLSGIHSSDGDLLQLRKERNEEIKENNKDELSLLLPTIEKGLINLWDGAKKALKGKNPDMARHIGSSLRTLIDKVLEILGPDEEIEKITTTGTI